MRLVYARCPVTGLLAVKKPAAPSVSAVALWVSKYTHYCWPVQPVWQFGRTASFGLNLVNSRVSTSKPDAAVILATFAIARFS